MAKKVPLKTCKQVIEFVSEGNTQALASKKFGLSKSMVSKIVNNDTGFVEKCEQKKEMIENDILNYLSSPKIIKTLDEQIDNIHNDVSQLILESKPEIAMRVFGILADKSLKAREIRLKEEQIKLNNKLLETYDPESDGFKQAMAKAMSNINNEYIKANINVQRNK